MESSVEDYRKQWIGTQMAAYERLLEAHYPDVPDEWDCYEDMASLHAFFAGGGTAERAFGQEHGVSWGSPSGPNLDGRSEADLNDWAD